MSRDDEAEQIAMRTAMAFEVEQGRQPLNVSADNVVYDVRSAEMSEVRMLTG